jgi:hypothetical protein
MAPISALKIHARVDDGRGDDPGAERLGHVQPEEQKGDEVEERRPDHGVERSQHPGRDDRRDRVRRIVHAVEEIEQEGDEDQADQQRQGERPIHRRRSAALRRVRSRGC